MKEIKDFPPELKELVKKRQIEQGNDGTFEGSIAVGKLYNNFNWDETPEEDLWYLLYSSQIIEAIKNHPKYPKIQTYDIY